MIQMPEISFLKLLVPTAGPAPAREKAEYIIKLARKIHAEILALHIVKDLSDKEKCDEGNEALKIFEDTCLACNIKITTFLREGELLPTIVKFSEDKSIDLIVMGVSEEGKMIADWIVSDIRYRKDLAVVIEPHSLGTISTQI